MILHNEAPFNIYFGDTRHKFDPKQFYGCRSNEELLQLQPFARVNRLLRCSTLVFMHQVHGSTGIAITKPEDIVRLSPSFSYDADFISTNITKIGLCIATADCLPIVMYDRLHHTVCIIHAGWRGALDNIVGKAFIHMQQTYRSQAEHFKVFLGPCAKACCYCVGGELLDKLDNFSYVQDVVHTSNGSDYFDLPKFCSLQLEELGIDKKAIITTYTNCTICDDSFCSFRRSQGKPERNMTVVTLK